MNITLELEREVDGRWIAEAPGLPGVLAYGNSREQASRRARALALRVLADRLENGEPDVGHNHISFVESSLGQMAVG